MRPTVALVETRPETISEDYRRVLDLAGLERSGSESSPPTAANGWDRSRILIANTAGTWVPGRTTPPWQLAGVLEHLCGETLAGDGDSCLVFGVGAHGAAAAADPAWEAILHRHGCVLAGDAEWQPRPVRVATNLPALGHLLPDGFYVPEALRGRSPVLLANVTLGAGWLLEGATAQLGRLLASRLRRDRRIPASEVRAETAGLASELFPRMGVVVDGTVWSVARGRGAVPVTRNILAAGRDPVAVDAVLLRLAGVDPRHVSWLRLCGERGFGTGDPGGIRICGATRLQNLDFGIPAATFAARPPRIAAGAGSWWRRWVPWTGARPARPWNELYAAYSTEPDVAGGAGIGTKS